MMDSHSSLFANICKENSWKVLGNFSENSDNPEWETIDYESLEYARSLVAEALTDDDFEDYVSQIFTTLKNAELTIIKMDYITGTPEGKTIKINQFLRDYFAEARRLGCPKWSDWRIFNGYDYDEGWSDIDEDSDGDSDDESDDDNDD
jgi:hypothetical protein